MGNEVIGKGDEECERGKRGNSWGWEGRREEQWLGSGWEEKGRKG